MARYLIVVCLAALVLSACGPRQGASPPSETPSQPAADPAFDPLASAEDRLVVPEAYPVEPAMIDDPGDSLAVPLDTPDSMYDSLMASDSPAEVYRVQIFTSRLYTEAGRERVLAEEIFNLPIYLDYEVPYYKLRVGDFVTRDEAENMLSEIKAIGYRNAWVARVILRTREIPESETEDNPILPDSAETAADTVFLKSGGDEQ
jgi:hypothetical protein